MLHKYIFDNVLDSSKNVFIVILLFFIFILFTVSLKSYFDKLNLFLKFLLKFRTLYIFFNSAI